MAPWHPSRRALLLGAVLSSVTRGTAAVQELGRFNSGYPQVDNGVLPTLQFLSRVFKLGGEWLPDFSFFDDGDKADARAVDGISGFRRMHVMIGRRAVAETMTISNGNFGAALTGIFAHEFGHVRQTMSGYRKALLAADSAGSVRLVEIHSDFLAGWAVPQAWWITEVADLAVAAEQFLRLGDVQFEAHGHHGTSLQRQTVMAAGYTWGLSNPGDPAKAEKRGEALLRDLFPQWFKSTL